MYSNQCMYSIHILPNGNLSQICFRKVFLILISASVNNFFRYEEIICILPWSICQYNCPFMVLYLFEVNDKKILEKKINKNIFEKNLSIWIYLYHVCVSQGPDDIFWRINFHGMDKLQSGGQVEEGWAEYYHDASHRIKP